MAVRQREFRAWQYEFKRMFEVKTLFLKGNGMEALWLNENGLSNRNQCYGYVGTTVELMEFIGKCDKNGKKIFEGDLVKSTRSNTYLGNMNDIYEIIYNEDLSMFCFKCVKSDSEYRVGKIAMSSNKPYIIISKQTEVIGNKFQNTNLLK